MKNYKIFSNKAQCKLCRDIIESRTTHDFKTCQCGKLSVDGGKEYLKRLGDIENIIELSEFYKDNRIVSYSEIKKDEE